MYFPGTTLDCFVVYGSEVVGGWVGWLVGSLYSAGAGTQS